MNERVRNLFSVPPAEFVRARDAAVKELRAGGHEAEARQAAALRRPTAVVWAVNQLARRNRDLLEEFADASDRVLHAQVRRASGDELRIAMAAQRGALAKLEQAAAGVLRGADAQPSPAALRAIQSTLQAAAAGAPEARRELLEGTLREAMEPAGFDALLAAGPAGIPRRGPEKPSSAQSRSAARKQTADAAHRAKEERRVIEREAKRQLAEARKRAAAARAAEQRLRKLEARARTAEDAAHRAREALVAARAALQRLRT